LAASASGTTVAAYGIRTASALAAATQPQAGTHACVLDVLPEEARDRAKALAAAVQLYPNFPLVLNWLSTEPYFPPAPEQAEPGDTPPPEPALAAE
jgi:hypothetical protein